jgi:hypothetical protein
MDDKYFLTEHDTGEFKVIDRNTMACKHVIHFREMVIREEDHLGFKTLICTVCHVNMKYNTVFLSCRNKISVFDAYTGIRVSRSIKS